MARWKRLGITGQWAMWIQGLLWQPTATWYLIGKLSLSKNSGEVQASQWEIPF